MQIKQRQGSYKFSCQFLNMPVSPEDADFKEEWLRYYTLETDLQGRKYVQHEVVNGIVVKDVFVNDMVICITTDPNHSGQTGRARHAIVVTGKASNGFTYVLETWAEACNYQKYFDRLYDTAKRWKCRKIGFETIAAQKYAAFHIEYRNQYEQWPIKIVELKGEVEAQDGTTTRNKEWRIQ